MFIKKNSIAVIFLFMFSLFSQNLLSADSIMIFAGSAGKPPTEEAARIFEKKTGIKVNIIFGGSGYVLSQMKLSRTGDIYFPGSSDYMETAKKQGLVFPDTEKKIVYLVPAINVWKGNPKNIKTLKDLSKPGLKIAIANPAGVCIGLYAVEILENNLSSAEKSAFKKNLINYTESCEKTATAVSLKMADAVIGWSVFQYWDPSRIETVKLKQNEIIRIGYIPAAVSKFTKNKKIALDFIDFLISDEGKKIFKKYSYFMSQDEAVRWIGGEKPVGGEYILPSSWEIK